MIFSDFFLGKSVSTWRISMLRQAIEHFCGPWARDRVKLSASKERLVGALDLIAQLQSLDDEDGFSTWRAIRDGQTLPPRRRFWNRLRQHPRREAVDRVLNKERRQQRSPEHYAEDNHLGAAGTNVPNLPAMPTPILNRLAADTQGTVSANAAENSQVEAIVPTTDNNEEEGIVDDSVVNSHEVSHGVLSALPVVEARISSARECNVCFDQITPANRPRRQITKTCNHEPDICTSCLRASISGQFANKVWDQIDCPSCRARVAYEDIKLFADSSVFGR